MVVERVNPLLRHLDNVLQHGSTVETCSWSSTPETSDRQNGMAMKNLDADNLGSSREHGEGNQVLCRDQYAVQPDIGVTNLTRDIRTAMLNLSTRVCWPEAEIAKRTFSPLRGIYSDLRNHREGRAPTSQWAATFEQFKKNGGATGYRDMYDTLNDRAKDLDRTN